MRNILRKMRHTRQAVLFRLRNMGLQVPTLDIDLVELRHDSPYYTSTHENIYTQWTHLHQLNHRHKAYSHQH